MVEELLAIEAPNVFITDDIFWLDVRRGEELARKIRAAGIRKYFTVQTRACASGSRATAPTTPASLSSPRCPEPTCGKRRKGR
ncbi:MAG TPA: hypothetical protein VLA66_14585 [Thermoanaerobaculia bacterium]|nr:hypothetical protein [Thermoanaerobaculia bacterium]